MAFVAVPASCPLAINRVPCGMIRPNSIPTAVRKQLHQVSRRSVKAAVSTAPAVSYEVEIKKHDLLNIIQETERGLKTTPEQRSSIEEALVAVEKYDAGEPVVLEQLDGTWRLQYTSAPDVLILFDAAARLPFLQVGQIFQKFECRNQSDGGVVKNIIRWSIQNLLEIEIMATNWTIENTMQLTPDPTWENEGATLLVSAKFSLVSRRNIFLQFEEISLQDISISELVQAVIAPAFLPRTYLNLQILQFIRSFKAQVPVTSPQSPRRRVGGLYYLSYLDNNMLLGRSVGGGGIFIFTRAQPFLC